MTGKCITAYLKVDHLQSGPASIYLGNDQRGPRTLAAKAAFFRGCREPGRSSLSRPATQGNPRGTNSQDEG